MSIYELTQSKILKFKSIDLSLSLGTRRRLQSLDILTVEELITWRESELLDFQDFGDGGVAEIKVELKRLGLHLAVESYIDEAA